MNSGKTFPETKLCWESGKTFPETKRYCFYPEMIANPLTQFFQKCLRNVEVWKWVYN